MFLQEYNSVHSYADWSNTSRDAAGTDHGKDFDFVFYCIVLYTFVF